MPIPEKDFQELSKQVALLGQSVSYQQEQIKDNTVSCKENRESLIVIKTKWAMIAILGGTAGTIIAGLISWAIKAKLGI